MVAGTQSLVVSRTIAVVATQNAAQAQRQLQQVQEASNSTSESFQRLRTSLLYLSFGYLALGGILGQFARSLTTVKDTMLNTYAGIEYSATQVSTILVGTAAETGRVYETMMQLGRETEYTATQVGEALTKLAMAGLNADEALDSVGGTLMLATIGMMDIDRATDIAVGALNSFNLVSRYGGDAAAALTQSVAMLAHSATNSAATVEMMGEAIKYAGAIAEMVNVSMAETIGFLMIAADNMQRAGIAGRSLRMSILRLSQAIGLQTNGVRMAQEVIDKYNVQLTNTDGSMKGLADTVDELDDKFGDMQDAQQLAIMTQLMGARASTSWAANLREGRDAMEAEREEWLKSHDTLEGFIPTYRSAGDMIRKNEIALEAATAKEMLYRAGVKDTTKVMKAWRSEIDRTGAVSAEFFDDMGMSAEEQQKIIDVLLMSRENTQLWTDAVEDASDASKIWEDRLATLEGSTKILESSIETLYAALAEDLAPFMMKFNKAMTDLANILSSMPKPLKMVVGFMVLFGSVIFTAASKVMLLLGSVVMLSAALVYMQRNTAGATKATQTYTWSQVKALWVERKRTQQAGLTVTGLRIVVREMKIAAYSTYMWVRANVKLLASMGILAVLAYKLTQYYKDGNQVMVFITGTIAGLVFWFGVLNQQQRNNVATALKNIAVKWREIQAEGGLIAAIKRKNIALQQSQVNYWAASMAAQGYTVTMHYSTAMNKNFFVATKVTSTGLKTQEMATWQGTAANWAYSTSLWAILAPLMLIAAVMFAVAFSMKKTEHGAQKVENSMERLSKSALMTQRVFQQQDKDFDSMYGHSTVPEYFRRGTGEVIGSLQTMQKAAVTTPEGIRKDIKSPLVDRFRRARSAAGKKVISPKIDINMSNMKVGSVKDAREIRDMVKLSVQQATDDLLASIEYESGGEV